MSSLVKRVLSSAILVVVFGTLVWLHGWFIVGFFTLVSLVIQYEMIKTIKTAGIKPTSIILFVFTAAMMPMYYFYGLAGVFVLQMFAVVLIFATCIIFKQYDYESIFSSIFCLYYPQLFFVFLYMILFVESPAGVWNMELSRLILLVAFGCSCMTDICAYFTGSLVGKTPLCKHISPKKTVEGAAGGLVGGIVGVEIVALIFDQGRVHLIEYAIFAFVLSIFAQLGDLAASVVKRRYGVKDFGSVIPGHGGFLDRMDSTLFILPLVYMFYKIYLGL